MTELLKQLLHNYGLLYITLHALSKERPGRLHDTLEQYYESLGPFVKDEPLIIFRISADGEMRILNKGGHDLALLNANGEAVGNVSVWELPEDEFCFFPAFRPGLFQLEKELPEFLHCLGVVYACATFENYLSEIIRHCLMSHPGLMGEKKQPSYGDVFEVATKDELLSRMIGEEIRDLLYLPITAVLDLMRKRFGFKKLKTDHDIDARRISLIRNCIVHNGARADARIAQEYPGDYTVDEAIKITLDNVNQAIITLRRLTYAIDVCAER